MKIMIEYNHIYSKNTKNTPKRRKMFNVSTCDHKHIDGYDTMYPCSEF